MSTIASLVIKLSADSSEMHKALGNVRRDVEKNVGHAGMDFSKGIVAGLGGIGLALAGVGAMSVKSAADMGMTKVAFTQMLGSAEKATAFVKDLQKFAAETPFEFEQVKGAAQKFLAFGFTAEQVIPVLTSVGNAAAGLGMGQDGIDRLTLALGQMAAKGKVSGEEMRQLAEAGIHLTVAETYDTLAVAYNEAELAEILRDGPPEVILLYSAVAARQFVRLDNQVNGAFIKGAKFIFCLSQRIAAELPEVCYFTLFGIISKTQAHRHTCSTIVWEH